MSSLTISQRRFANDDPTVVQPLAAQNPAQIQSELEGFLYLPLTNQLLIISQGFLETANDEPTNCVTRGLH